MHHTTAEVTLMPLGRESVPGTLCIQNVLATAHQTAGATLAGAPPTARLSKCTISSVTRAWSGMTTLKPRQRSTHVLEHAQTHHGIPLHTKDARNSTSDSARNSRVRHPARPSKCTISSTVRARSGTPTHIIRYIYYIKNADICLLSFIMGHSTHSGSGALALSSVWAGGAYTGT